MTALLRLVWIALAAATSLTRAHRAFVSQPATTFPPAAGAESVITQRLPRGWVPTGRVIDVEVGAP